MKHVKARALANVLLSWVSVNNHAAPLRTLLETPSGPFANRDCMLYLCWRDTEDGDAEKEAVRSTKTALRTLKIPPKIIDRKWSTTCSPTDHDALRPFVEDTLRFVRQQHPIATINILLSPGTPAMHAVWLLLGSTGFIEGKVRMFQTMDPRAGVSGAGAVREVNLSVNSWLSHFRASHPASDSAEDNGQLWDPTKLKSPAIKQVLSLLDQWAALRVPVLFVGERGTGKTTLANYLRSISPFKLASRPSLPVVVCGQFRGNPDLARSELFGHCKGAFSGASEDRVGLLEQSDQDTLFLDEIADLDRDTQRLLIAALEGRGFYRMGESRPRQSQFRLISATNHSLDSLANSLLDRDFFDRIAVFVLRVPSLQECREDLPEFWSSVLSSAVRSSGVQARGWERYRAHAEIIEMLRTHPLPDNFRTLRRAAFHLAAEVHSSHSEDACIRAVRQSLASPISVEGSKIDLAEAERDGIESILERTKMRWIDAAMERANHNTSEAARLLNVSRTTLRDWLQKTPNKSRAK